jgi:hypothetical protein
MPDSFSLRRGWNNEFLRPLDGFGSVAREYCQFIARLCGGPLVAFNRQAGEIDVSKLVGDLSSRAYASASKPKARSRWEPVSV